MILTMGAVGLIASVVLVGTYRATLPYIENNRIEALNAAVFDILPGSTRKVDFLLLEDGTIARDDEKLTGRAFYATYDESDRLTGFAIESSGQGFQDVIRLLYGYDPDAERVVGIRVLESKETPGLGDKIEKDAMFLADVGNLDVGLTSDGSAVANPVALVKSGEKTEEWQIQAITGATVSSRAVARILHESTLAMLPAIRSRLDDLKEGGKWPSQR